MILHMGIFIQNMELDRVILYPLHFHPCIEPLITHCNNLTLIPKLHMGILSSPRSFCVANLVFVNNCLLFARATTRGTRKVLDLLTLFASASGQQVNFHKSSISNISNQTINDIVTILNIQHKTTIGTYLGINNIVFWKDPINELELIKRVKQKLACCGKQILCQKWVG